MTYAGKPVITYFFSTSGGKTENVENAFLGAEPTPYLKSVDDPFDDASPRHKWGPYRYTLSRAQSKLGGLVKGRLKRIKVVKRGVSPRIVKAQVIGTKGTRTVSGPELRRRFGLYDTWATFTLVSSTAKPAPTGPSGPSGTKGDTKSGGAAPAARASSRSPPNPKAPRIVGRILPSEPGDWLKVQRRAKGRWVDVAEVTVARNGRYEASLPRAGSYRVLYEGIAGPTVRAR